eukprot:763346-Hanusia_phi.AAC.1
MEMTGKKNSLPKSKKSRSSLLSGQCSQTQTRMLSDNLVPASAHVRFCVAAVRWCSLHNHQERTRSKFAKLGIEQRSPFWSEVTMPQTRTLFRGPVERDFGSRDL